uniref:Photosystem II reaction center protein T n=1 Tax=Codium fragile TaxID=3133 RepID=A0A6B9PFK5_CODFR|nr:photosystem II reaction center protein T [Codium fragile]QZW16056.1 photosystem II reaction center protein T [Codium fragile subsp. tomentosoides]UBX69798.1 photosystem reaction center T protein [Codium amplivesiculatum]QZW16071.1 photosystem II reaction center protein T [Codium fragile]QZW16073.1 photosystem II reaction center protein T [Codium fragile subsp. tomentosoides]
MYLKSINWNIRNYFFCYIFSGTSSNY